MGLPINTSKFWCGLIYASGPMVGDFTLIHNINDKAYGEIYKNGKLVTYIRVLPKFIHALESNLREIFLGNRKGVRREVYCLKRTQYTEISDIKRSQAIIAAVQLAHENPESKISLVAADQAIHAAVEKSLKNQKRRRAAAAVKSAWARSQYLG